MLLTTLKCKQKLVVEKCNDIFKNVIAFSTTSTFFIFDNKIDVS